MPPTMSTMLINNVILSASVHKYCRHTMHPSLIPRLRYPALPPFLFCV